MKRSAFVFLIVSAMFLAVSCSDPYEYVEQGGDGVCQVEGHKADYHASAYDYKAGDLLKYDVVDGAIVVYAKAQPCTCHSFEVWRCATCGQFWKKYVHTFEDGTCIICGCEQE